MYVKQRLLLECLNYEPNEHERIFFLAGGG